MGKNNSAKAQIDDADTVRRVQIQPVGCGGQGKHHHLERDYHGEYKEIVECLGIPGFHPGNKPRAHGAAD